MRTLGLVALACLLVPGVPARTADRGDDSALTIDIGKGQTLRLARIRAGSFTMGAETDPNQRPPHKVTLSRGFWLGQTEVTRGQFAAFVAATDYRTDAERDGWCLTWGREAFAKTDGACWVKPGFEQADDHPVVAVSWEDAMAFCRWLSQRSELKVTLATEAQWEYGCRAGTIGPFYTGQTLSSDQANHQHSQYWPNQQGRARDGTVPARKFEPNPWGLYGMHGNAAEWCSDSFASYPQGPVVDPAPCQGDERVIRGGGWSGDPCDCLRSEQRGYNHPHYRNNTIGFRILIEEDRDL